MLSLYMRPARYYCPLWPAARCMKNLIFASSITISFASYQCCKSAAISHHKAQQDSSFVSINYHAVNTEGTHKSSQKSGTSNAIIARATDHIFVTILVTHPIVSAIISRGSRFAGCLCDRFARVSLIELRLYMYQRNVECLEN